MPIIRLAEFIEKEEGKRNEAYQDESGYWTIGIGHLLKIDELTSGKIRINDDRIKYRHGLTDEEVYALFEQDIHLYRQVVKVMVTVDLTHNQEVALTSLCYNIGPNAFIDSTMLKQLNNGKYENMHYWFRRWIWSGGKISKILIGRREREIITWDTPDD